MDRLHRVRKVFDKNALGVRLDRQNWTAGIVSATTSLRLTDPVVAVAVGGGDGGNL